MYNSIVSESLASDLRDFGFQEYTTYYYDLSDADGNGGKLKTSTIYSDDGSITINTYIPVEYNASLTDDKLSAPTYADVFDYFKRRYQIELCLIPVMSMWKVNTYRYMIVVERKLMVSKKVFKNFAEAAEEAIRTTMHFCHKQEEDEGFIGELFENEYKDVTEL